MAEEKKPVKTIPADVAQKIETFNLKVALTYACLYGIGVASGAYLALSGFFG